MKTRNAVIQPKERITPSKRTRQSSLLFNGAPTGTTLPTLATFLEPKIPPYKGE